MKKSVAAPLKFDHTFQLGINIYRRNHKEEKVIFAISSFLDDTKKLQFLETSVFTLLAIKTTNFWAVHSFDIGDDVSWTI